MSSPQRPIRVLEREEIVLSDGTILSALIWLPEDAESNPVPAILEYLPYRKRDSTSWRDAVNHPYVAAHGYACVRVDMRGSGDSEGVLLGEYLQQELDDGVEIISWLAAQPWCTGAVGMIGISWGGFNGLQVAALRPPALRAVLSICSTDDRYDDDIHYMGGCMLLDNFLWASTMFAINSTPPDPAIVGDKWRKLWMDRLESGGLWTKEWHEHTRRDEFWKHASICEDYSAVQCPVYLVGGWLDPYHRSIFRMLEHLECPKKGLVGPWAHSYPNFAKPGPQIGFLQESVRWWDKWLKGIETGIMDEPMLRCYLQDTVPPRTQYSHRPGHWVAEPSWPSPGIKSRQMNLAPGALVDGSQTSDAVLSICSPQTLGFASGRWLVYGKVPDGPGDQRQEAGGSLVFDSQPLDKPLDILGQSLARLRIASDKSSAFVAVTVSEVLPDGSATRISYGLLNLTHRESHVDVKPLDPGQFYDVTVKLDECGQRISSGSRIRLALSSTYFPIAWPSPEITTLSVDCAHSSLELPVRPDGPLDSCLKPFLPAVNGEPPAETVLREGGGSSNITQDLATGEVVLRITEDSGLNQIDAHGWRYGESEKITCRIRPDDPLSARSEESFRQEFGRGDLSLVVEGSNDISVSKTEFHITARVKAWEGKESVFEREYAFSVPRDI